MDRKPEWLRKNIDPKALKDMQFLLRSLSLHTVCESANCPNRGDCFRAGTATFMILGNICTRNCHFCAIRKGEPLPPDSGEPGRIAEAAQKLKLQHVVVTSVTRDDLDDGGAGHFAATIIALKSRLPESTIEVLIPDFQGSAEALSKVVGARPDIINHNLETVPSLYKKVRPQAIYVRSLELLKRVNKSGIYSKTGIMVGLGETKEEVLSLMDDLAKAGCDMMTIGQYLQPSKEHLSVAGYIRPEQFEEYKRIAIQKGIKYVASAPLVRSSYNAAKSMEEIKSI
jgi:lipoic acid synthetase